MKKINQRKRKYIQLKECSLNTEEGLISYLLTRSCRRKTIEIVVKDETTVRIYAPTYIAEKDILSFIHERAKWIIAKKEEWRTIHKKIQRRSYTNGNVFLFLGQKYPIHIIEDHVKRSKIIFTGKGWDIFIPFQINEKERQAEVKKILIKWYRNQAKEVLGGRILFYARQISADLNKIVVRSQKRIWGSCHYKTKSIHLNWQLILCPFFVIDYVVAHELCHLEFPNHSRKFWKKVEEHLPDYKIRQKWLREHHFDIKLPD